MAEIAEGNADQDRRHEAAEDEDEVLHRLVPERIRIVAVFAQDREVAAEIGAEDRDGRNDGENRDGDPGQGFQREFHERIGGDETESEKRDPEAGSERDARKRRCADEKRARHPARRPKEERRREACEHGAQRPASGEAGGERERQEGQRRKRRAGRLGPLPDPVADAAQDAVRLEVGERQDGQRQNDGDGHRSAEAQGRHPGGEALECPIRTTAAGRRCTGRDRRPADHFTMPFFVSQSLATA